MINCGYFFYKCDRIKQIIFTNFNINNVTNMSYMFKYCSYLSTLPDISKWNTNNVSNMNDMFDGCDNLKNIPSKFKENNCLIS